MLEPNKRYLSRSFSLFSTAIALIAMAGVAVASQGVVRDRRVSLQEAMTLAEAARKKTDFPITVNEAVLKELNRFVGTPDGREIIKNALARMESYRPLVEGNLAGYGLPRELMAIPIMESGYQNLAQSPHPQHSAGVWQFTPQTARNYGMRVDKEVDERLNAEKETDSACRYLGALNLRFQDWELAVMAYNAGEFKVQAGVRRRDREARGR